MKAIIRTLPASALILSAVIITQAQSTKPVTEEKSPAPSGTGARADVYHVKREAERCLYKIDHFSLCV